MLISKNNNNILVFKELNLGTNLIKAPPNNIFNFNISIYYKAFQNIFI